MSRFRSESELEREALQRDRDRAAAAFRAAHPDVDFHDEPETFSAALDGRDPADDAYDLSDPTDALAVYQRERMEQGGYVA